jgi:hypothetical protein
MFASGNLVPGYFVLIKRACFLKCTFLACLMLAGPIFSGVQAQAVAEPGHFKASDTLSTVPEEPLIAWFKEQDRLLDGILLRLSRIELLVNDIHRLIQQMPAPSATTAPATPAPVSVPIAAVVPPPPSEVPGFDVLELLDNLAIQLAGGGLLLLLLLLLWSRQRKKAGLAVQNKSFEAGSASSARFAPPVAPAEPPQTSEQQVPDMRMSPEVMPTEVPAPQATAPAQHVPEAIQDRPRVLTGNNSATRTSEQALELAEIMLAMGLGQGAAKTLTAQINNEPKHALRNWLKLLEIYRRNGQQDEFERSADELRQHFNVQPEDWQSTLGELRSIEDYPHITAEICEHWDKPDCSSHLVNLLGDNRYGTRTGFPQAVAEELLLLNTILQAKGSGG